MSFVDAAFRGLSWRGALTYLPAQVAGCVSGAVVANLMFDADALSISDKSRDTAAHTLSEVIATVGLLLVIFSLVRTGRVAHAPAAVGAYIGAAYFFTSSTSVANPAIRRSTRSRSSHARGRDPQAPPRPRLAHDTVESSDVVITMGCGDACPAFPGKRYEDWQLTDPAGQPIDVVRQVRDDIRARIERLMASLGITPSRWASRPARVIRGGQQVAQPSARSAGDTGWRPIITSAADGKHSMQRSLM